MQLNLTGVVFDPPARVSIVSHISLRFDNDPHAITVRNLLSHPMQTQPHLWLFSDVEHPIYQMSVSLEGNWGLPVCLRLQSLVFVHRNGLNFLAVCFF